MDIQHYKYLAEGTITLIGNSCQIEENISGLSGEEQSWIRFYNLHYGKHHRHKPTPPKREAGDIKGFSKKSRLRLLKKVNRVDHENKTNPYFITLTYPKKYPKEREEYKSDLDAFFKRLNRSSFGNFEYLWRLEAQKRGAPHYHLLVYFANEINRQALIKWVSQNWFEVAQRNWNIKDEKQLKAGTQCKCIKEYRQVVYYISKYMAKEDSEKLKDQGRYWGTSKGWEDFIASDKLEGKELIWFRRILNRYLKRTNKYMSKKVVKGGNIEIWAPKDFIGKAFLWCKYHGYERALIF